jgi:hypothetical protein
VTDPGTRSDAVVFGFFGKSPRQEPKVPPQAVGQWLGSRLDERCTITNLTDEQQGLADLVGLPLARLFDEISILSAFSIDFAILSLLQENPHRDNVRQGFISSIQAWPTESVNKSVRVQSGLQQKGQQYHAAIMETLTKAPERVGDPLADAFCDFIYPRPPLKEIQQSPKLAAEFGRAHMLAMLTVQHDFWYYQELCQHIFAESGLAKMG